MPRPRTIVTADPELDDLNSMIRLLLYSNEIDIEGLVYASSRFHWKGDGRRTPFFLPDRGFDTPQTSWRWAPGERFIDDAIDAYASVSKNLRAHDAAYPDPEYLRSVVREGNVAFEGDTSTESPGSRLIADALLNEKPGPLHLQAWAGTSTIARALMSIEAAYGHSPEWATIASSVSRTAIITKYGSQDDTYDGYIARVWPQIRVTDVTNGAWGYWIRHVRLADDRELLSSRWMAENVTSVGPLGALYRVWGDGRQMVEGDMTDYFHLAGRSRADLEDAGYRVWTDPCPAGEWISEGDTANMLNLIGNGLRGYEHPSFGGWGGRAGPDGRNPDSWDVRNAKDADAEGGFPAEYSLSRWFRAAQNDFAERLRWSVTPRYRDANHAPVVRMPDGLDREVRAGGEVVLEAEISDPDGDETRCRWWQYVEAGSYGGEIQRVEDHGTRSVYVIPPDAVPGQTLHFIAEARDLRDRALSGYARVVLTVVG